MQPTPAFGTLRTLETPSDQGPNLTEGLATFSQVAWCMPSSSRAVPPASYKLNKENDKCILISNSCLSRTSFFSKHSPANSTEWNLLKGSVQCCPNPGRRSQLEFSSPSPNIFYCLVSTVSLCKIWVTSKAALSFFIISEVIENCQSQIWQSPLMSLKTVLITIITFLWISYLESNNFTMSDSTTQRCINFICNEK